MKRPEINFGSSGEGSQINDTRFLLDPGVVEIPFVVLRSFGAGALEMLFFLLRFRRRDSFRDSFVCSYSILNVVEAELAL